MQTNKSKKQNISKEEKIKTFWDQEANSKGTSLHATMPDFYLKQIEIRSILKHIRRNTNVIDIGCGNGYSSLIFAKKRKINLTGIDYSPEMIKKAKIALNEELKKFKMKSSVKFSEGNVQTLSKITKFSKHFDTAITERCLINLTSHKDQAKSLEEIASVLKPDGTLLVCEHTEDGLKGLNLLRNKFSLPEIKTRWHNIYLKEDDFLSAAKKYFKLESVENISSTYYLLSRVVYARMAADEKKEPDYFHPINKIAYGLPEMGNFGSLKLFVLRKSQ